MDEEVPILPALLGGLVEVVEEPVEGVGQFVGFVQGERRVVVVSDLVDQSSPGRSAGELETGHLHEVEPAESLLESSLVVKSCLAGGKIRKTAAPDRVGILFWCPGVDEQITARLQHSARLVYELAEIEVVNSVECGHEVH